MITNITNQPPFDLEILIVNLRKEDARNLKLTHKMQLLMWVMAVLYLLLTLLEFIMSENWVKPFGATLVMASFLVLALFNRYFQKEYKSIDYAVPTIEMLTRAAMHYQVFHGRLLYILITLVVEDIGLCFFMSDIFKVADPLPRFLIAQVSFIILLVFGFFVGYRIWRKHQKPLRDMALLLLKELGC